MTAAFEIKRRPLETVHLLRRIVAGCEEMEAVPGDNPQIVAMRNKAKAERELAEAVIAALGGDMVMLKLYVRGK